MHLNRLCESTIGKGLMHLAQCSQILVDENPSQVQQDPAVEALAYITALSKSSGDAKLQIYTQGLASQLFILVEKRQFMVPVACGALGGPRKENRALLQSESGPCSPSSSIFKRKPCQ